MAQHEESSIDTDSILSNDQKEPISILSYNAPPHETPNPRVMSEPPAEMDTPSNVSVKNFSWVISDLHNSYDYTQDIECITMEGHSDYTDSVGGSFLMCDVVSDTHISASSKHEHIYSVATSVNISLHSQEKETVSQIQNYCDYSKYIECITM